MARTVSPWSHVVSMLFAQLMSWNEIAKLSENAELGCGWLGVSFFHLCRVTELRSHANHFFFVI